MQKKQLARKKSNCGDPRSTAVIAHAAVRAKRPLWSLIAQQTAQTVLGDGRHPAYRARRRGTLCTISLRRCARPSLIQRSIPPPR
ncbi:hypothetical protein FA95DRAFT_1340796 [Auriscalpium vulgare]|uniref:Uncharacterized protein n=1 Tax=Auriscalpium vulgare TaxID=40419 RepID=A0ACB8R1R6_9AGAM|nr:hypothetical protein FA95DRAFT_1340796 [Auriscalpium vulgare]